MLQNFKIAIFDGFVPSHLLFALAFLHDSEHEKSHINYTKWHSLFCAKNAISLDRPELKHTKQRWKLHVKLCNEMTAMGMKYVFSIMHHNEIFSMDVKNVSPNCWIQIRDERKNKHNFVLHFAMDSRYLLSFCMRRLCWFSQIYSILFSC